MAIALRAYTDTVPSGTGNNQSGGDITINKPSGTVDNDIMIACLYSEYSSTAWSLPSGWAWWGGATGQKAYTSNCWVYLAWKKASSEGSSYTFTHGGTAWRIACIASFSGAYTGGDPEDSTGPTGYATTGDVYALAASVTTSSANDMVIAASANYNGNTLGAASSGMTLSGQIAGCGILYVLQASAGASGVKTFTNVGSEVWATWTVAIKEAASAPTLEQEGHRYRNDDGSETTATWDGAQDGNLTAAVGVNKRLREIINATGDYASDKFRLEYKISTDSARKWRQVI